MGCGCGACADDRLGLVLEVVGLLFLWADIGVCEDVPEDGCLAYGLLVVCNLLFDFDYLTAETSLEI